MDRLLTQKQVIDHVGLSRQMIYNLRQAGRFPAPVDLGSRALRWRESAVSAWMDGLPRAGDGS